MNPRSHTADRLHFSLRGKPAAAGRRSSRGMTAAGWRARVKADVRDIAGAAQPPGPRTWCELAAAPPGGRPPAFISSRETSRERPPLGTRDDSHRLAARVIGGQGVPIAAEKKTTNLVRSPEFPASELLETRLGLPDSRRPMRERLSRTRNPGDSGSSRGRSCGFSITGVFENALPGRSLVFSPLLSEPPHGRFKSRSQPHLSRATPGSYRFASSTSGSGSLSSSPPRSRTGGIPPSPSTRC